MTPYQMSPFSPPPRVTTTPQPRPQPQPQPQPQPAAKKPAPQPAAQPSADAGTTTSPVTYDAASARFIQDGKKFTLTELLFKIGGRAATVAKETLATSIEHLDDSNKAGDAAVAWMNKLRSQQPSSDGTYSATTLNQARNQFKAQYGFDPMDKYQISTLKKNNGATYTQDEMDKMTDATKSFAGTISSNQQSIQLDVSRYTHVVEEANQLIASVNKAMTDTITSITSKMS